MKIKELAIEIGLILLNLGGAFYVFSLGFENELASFGGGIISGFMLVYYFVYWQMKKQLLDTEHPNAERAIRIWRVIMVACCISSVLLCFIVSKGIVKNNNIFGAYFFLLASVWANYRTVIMPDYEPMYSFLEDEDVRKKTYRLMAKVLFFSSVTFAIICFFVNGKLLIFLMLLQGLIVLLAQYFYGKHLHNLKYK